jgi:hypothetical protein
MQHKSIQEPFNRQHRPSTNYHTKHSHSRPKRSITRQHPPFHIYTKNAYHGDIADQPLRDHSAEEIKLENRVVLPFWAVAILENIKRVAPIARAPIRVAYRVRAIRVHLRLQSAKYNNDHKLNR